MFDPKDLDISFKEMVDVRKDEMMRDIRPNMMSIVTDPRTGQQAKVYSRKVDRNLQKCEV